jgi:hypothetical protein
MSGRRVLVKTGSAAAVALAALAFGSPHVGAHSQIVQPPSKDEPVVQKPISNAWAQAHCRAASPEVLGTEHVVGFAPFQALPCPPVENPGGQVHP